MHEGSGTLITCADMDDWGCGYYTDVNTGVAAAELCPASCVAGCALTYDTCWNQQETCQNGGVCVNLPGVEAFRCECPAHYGGPTCETYCGPDQECVSLAEFNNPHQSLSHSRVRAVQCEDDPAFVHNNMFDQTCADLNVYEYGCEQWADDNTGVPAAEACPASCVTGCALTYESCWDQQDTCQNGGVCVNLPGVESFFCDCAPHYMGPTCETYCGPDQDCVRLV
eukprot:COSAG04_NODE_827_length_10036_cov_6.659455_2_plen_225_part_00